MLNKNALVSIKNGVSKTQLINALIKARWEDSEILKIHVMADNSMIFTEFDGICITQWYVKDVFNFIDKVAEKGYDNTMKISQVL